MPVPNLLYRSCARNTSLLLFPPGGDECPCEECARWYEEDRANTAWLDRLNRAFPCPCTEAIANSQSADWGADLACYAYGLPRCGKFHPGADHCIRSARSTVDGARQQCCYNAAGDLLRPGHPGAGTPDRAADFSEHQRLDVEPYEKCCSECDIESYCDYYMELRMGNADHCQ